MEPPNAERWLEIRGDVDLHRSGPVEHLDRLTRTYTTYPRYAGYVYPPERRDLETRVIARIHPRRINRDAIHS